MNVALTGSTGYIGRRLKLALPEQGDGVIFKGMPRKIINSSSCFFIETEP
jgi:nucleoside-diphosphate-sugar epimerase